MTKIQFENELKTLEKFFTCYCKNKHTKQMVKTLDITYKDEQYTLEVSLCMECEELLTYSIAKLQACKYEEKPKCRKCPSPCYEKEKRKSVSKVMRYSGIKLGISKLKTSYISFIKETLK